MEDILELIGIEKTQNEFGVWVEKPAPRTVFCETHSISRSEFFNAGRSGLNPQLEFTVFAGDYNGETICRYRGQSLAIYRTYHAAGSDYIELYAEREGGRNGFAQSNGG